MTGNFNFLIAALSPGAAAGIAAAMAAERNLDVRKTDTKLLRKKLSDLGMYL